MISTGDFTTENKRGAIWRDDLPESLTLRVNEMSHTVKDWRERINTMEAIGRPTDKLKAKLAQAIKRYKRAQAHSNQQRISQ